MNIRFMSRFMGATCLMSAAGEQVSNTVTPADELAKEVAELKETFAKKDKIFVGANDDQTAFAALVTELGANIHDFTQGADENTFTGMGLAKSENGRIALIPLASEEAVFADPVVRKALYKLYRNKVLNAATDDESTAAQFITVAGLFKQKFDIEGFNGIAKAFIKFLKKSGLIGINKNSLRQSFQSTAFALTQFPRTTKEQWQQLLEMAKAIAKKNELDTSIFQHWQDTRDVQSADTSVLKLDFAKFGVDEDEDEDEPTEANTAPNA